VPPRSQKLPAIDSNCDCAAAGGGRGINLVDWHRKGREITVQILQTYTKCRLRNSKRHVVSPDSRNPSPIRKLPTLQLDPQIPKPPARSPKFRSSYTILKPFIYYRTALMYRPLLVLAVVLACPRARDCQHQEAAAIKSSSSCIHAMLFDGLCCCF
jgi:hypothetical protein